MESLISRKKTTAEFWHATIDKPSHGGKLGQALFCAESSQKLSRIHKPIPSSGKQRIHGPDDVGTLAAHPYLRF